MYSPKPTSKPINPPLSLPSLPTVAILIVEDEGQGLSAAICETLFPGLTADEREQVETYLDYWELHNGIEAEQLTANPRLLPILRERIQGLRRMGWIDFYTSPATRPAQSHPAFNREGK